MIEMQACAALSALAQPVRLRAFRLLVQAGPEGLTPSVLSRRLDVTPSALSFHLKELTHAGLTEVEPDGRSLIYRASFARMNDLLHYLSENCCAGVTCVPISASPCTTDAVQVQS